MATTAATGAPAAAAAPIPGGGGGGVTAGGGGGGPPPAPPTNVDKDRLELLFQSLFAIDPTGWPDHDIKKALDAAGIQEFYGHFVGMTEADLMMLTIPQDGTTPAYALPIAWKRQLIIVLALFHHLSRLKGKRIQAEKITRGVYQVFRMDLYNPHNPIIPWTLPDGKAQNELDNWNRSIKKSTSDFKEFKDPAYFLPYKEDFESTLYSLGLHHTIDPNYVPHNPDLYTAQCMWVMKACREKWLAPGAKKIVKNYRGNSNMPAMWTEFDDMYTKSMTAEMRAQQISTYMTSTRLHLLNWRGTQESFVLNFAEHARVYNLISEEPYTDKTQIQFLSAALAGTPNLANVLINHRSAAKAAGRDPTLKFDEYCALLVLAAQTYDGGNKLRANPRATRSVNCTDFNFDDDDPEQESGLELEAHIHDADTPIEDLIVMQTESAARNQGFQTRRSGTSSSGPRPVRMNKETWYSLTSSDQSTWDKISDDGKKKILEYAAKRYTNSTQGNRAAPSRQVVNSHEISFDDDEVAGQVEVSTHQVQQQSTEGSKSSLSAPPKDQTAMTVSQNGKSQRQPAQRQVDLLSVPNPPTRKVKNPHANGIDINHVMSSSSKAPREISTHEGYLPRSDQTPECFTLEINAHDLFNDLLRSDSSDGGSPQQDFNTLVAGINFDDDDDDKSSKGQTNKPATVATADLLGITRDTTRAPISTESTRTSVKARKAAPFKDSAEAFPVRSRDTKLLALFDFEEDKSAMNQADFRDAVEAIPTEGDEKIKSPPRHGHMKGKFSSVPVPSPLKGRTGLASDGQGIAVYDSSKDVPSSDQLFQDVPTVETTPVEEHLKTIPSSESPSMEEEIQKLSDDEEEEDGPSPLDEVLNTSRGDETDKIDILALYEEEARESIEPRNARKLLFEQAMQKEVTSVKESGSISTTSFDERGHIPGVEEEKDGSTEPPPGLITTKTVDVPDGPSSSSTLSSKHEPDESFVASEPSETPGQRNSPRAARTQTSSPTSTPEDTNKRDAQSDSPWYDNLGEPNASPTLHPDTRSLDGNSQGDDLQDETTWSTVASRKNKKNKAKKQNWKQQRHAKKQSPAQTGLVGRVTNAIAAVSTPITAAVSPRGYSKVPASHSSSSANSSPSDSSVIDFFPASTSKTPSRNKQGKGAGGQKKKTPTAQSSGKGGKKPSSQDFGKAKSR